MAQHMNSLESACRIAADAYKELNASTADQKLLSQNVWNDLNGVKATYGQEGLNVLGQQFASMDQRDRAGMYRSRVEICADTDNLALPRAISVGLDEHGNFTQVVFFDGQDNKLIWDNH